MNRVLRILAGQAQFNQDLLSFLQAINQGPVVNTASVLDTNVFGSIVNTTLGMGISDVSPSFYEIDKYKVAAPPGTVVVMDQHKVHLDDKNKPKTFYTIKVFFQDKQPLKKNAADQSPVQLHVLSMQKVYGDFKRLHNYIIETFENERTEYERFQELQSQQVGDQSRMPSLSFSQNDLNKMKVNGLDENNNFIALNDRTSEELYEYGKQYYDEALRILENLPMLPAKCEQVDFMGSSEKTKVPPE